MRRQAFSTSRQRIGGVASVRVKVGAAAPWRRPPRDELLARLHQAPAVAIGEVEMEAKGEFALSLARILARLVAQIGCSPVASSTTSAALTTAAC